MPRSEKSNRAFATTSSSRSRLIAVNTGAAWPELAVGRVLCATTQIEQDEDSVRVGWWCVDSAAAVHTISERHNHVDHRIHKRIAYRTTLSCFGIRLVQLITVIHRNATRTKLL